MQHHTSWHSLRTKRQVDELRHTSRQVEARFDCDSDFNLNVICRGHTKPKPSTCSKKSMKCKPATKKFKRTTGRPSKANVG